MFSGTTLIKVTCFLYVLYSQGNLVCIDSPYSTKKKIVIHSH